MMSNTIESKNLDPFEQETHVRPTLLTVLCILTFIGSSWTILSGTWGYSTAKKTSKIFSTIVTGTGQNSSLRNDSAIRRIGDKKRSFFGQKMMGSLSKMMTAENIRKNAIGAIISGLFTLAGAFFMWRLRRYGFYFYIAGILIGFLVPFYLYGNNIIATGMSVFSGFFGLVFLALYGLNFKTLR